MTYENKSLPNSSSNSLNRLVNTFELPSVIVTMMLVHLLPSSLQNPVERHMHVFERTFKLHYKLLRLSRGIQIAIKELVTGPVTSLLLGEDSRHRRVSRLLLLPA